MHEKKHKLTNYHKALIFLVMLYMIIMPCSISLTNKIMSIGPEYASAGSLILPFLFVLSDVIAEVYGYEISRYIFICSLICQFIFVFLCYSLTKLPHPSFWTHQHAFDIVFGNILHLYSGGLVAMLVAGYINIYFVTRWKRVLNGRYFWLRSIGSSTIGEALYTALAFVLMFIGTLPMAKIGMFIVWAYLFKVLYAVVFAFPANLLTNWLKVYTSTHLDGEGAYINPFNKLHNMPIEN